MKLIDREEIVEGKNYILQRGATWRVHTCTRIIQYPERIWYEFKPLNYKERNIYTSIGLVQYKATKDWNMKDTIVYEVDSEEDIRRVELMVNV